jgi:hypothetical protein
MGEMQGGGMLGREREFEFDGKGMGEVMRGVMRGVMEN